MECPYCNKELTYEGNYSMLFYNIVIKGHLYICKNEKCNHYKEYFHTINDDDTLYEVCHFNQK